MRLVRWVQLRVELVRGPTCLVSYRDGPRVSRRDVSPRLSFSRCVPRFLKSTVVLDLTALTVHAATP